MKKHVKLLMGLVAKITIMTMFTITGNAANGKVNPRNPLSEQVLENIYIATKDGRLAKRDTTYYVFDKADANQKSGCFSCNSIEAAEKIANRPQLRKAFYKTPNKSKNGITFYNYSYDNNSILKIWKPNDESNAQTFNLPRDKWAHFKEHLPENESGLTITNQWQRMTAHFIRQIK